MNRDEVSGRFRVRCSREWTDAEPDTLTISVCEDAIDGMPSVVFSGSSTWIADEIVEDQIIPWLQFCVTEARHLQ